MLRFSIRDLLWLTVVAAMATAWWLDRNSLKRSPYSEDGIWQQRANSAAEVLMAQGWTVVWKGYIARYIKERPPKPGAVNHCTYFLVPWNSLSFEDDPDRPGCLLDNSPAYNGE